ncbi:FAD-dependent oxidoreductase [Arthrobacter echini]|nr:FAD-dependent oxidoreductase [Arthrobacter echini]
MHRIDDIVDLLVVGGGTAGIVGARTAAKLGAKVLPAERSRTGGDCLWTGCVPSKTLLSAAAAGAHHDGTNAEYFAVARRRVAAAITAVEPDDAPETLRAACVEAHTVGPTADTGGSGSVVVSTSDGASYRADVLLSHCRKDTAHRRLGLQGLGVDLDEDGHVLVSAAMRTSASTIWAAGDVTTHADLTHVAGAYASTAVSNAVLGLRRSISLTVPRVTYTSPEVAAVGVTSVGGRGLRESVVQHSHADRAITEGQEEGFSRLIIGRGGRILGGTIVGPRAGESPAELTLAVQRKLSTTDLAAVIHPYPTYNDALWNAALADARTALESRPAMIALSLLIRLTRRRVTRRRQPPAVG